MPQQSRLADELGQPVQADPCCPLPQKVHAEPRLWVLGAQEARQVHQDPTQRATGVCGGARVRSLPPSLPPAPPSPPTLLQVPTDVFVHDEIPHTRPGTRGLLLSLLDGAEVSATITEEQAYPDPFESGRVVADPDDPTRLWTLRDLSASLGQTEAWLFTENEDGDAENSSMSTKFLLSLHGFSYTQAHRTDAGVSVAEALKLNRQIAPDAEAGGGGAVGGGGGAVGGGGKTGGTGDGGGGGSGGGDGGRAGVDDAAGGRGDRPNADVNGRGGRGPPMYLNSAIMDTPRFLLTADTLNALAELGDSFFLTVVQSVPNFARPPAEILAVNRGAHGGLDTAAASEIVGGALRVDGSAVVTPPKVRPIHSQAGSEVSFKLSDMIHPGKAPLPPSQAKEAGGVEGEKEGGGEEGSAASSPAPPRPPAGALGRRAGRWWAVHAAAGRRQRESDRRHHQQRAREHQRRRDQGRQPNQRDKPRRQSGRDGARHAGRVHRDRA